MPSREERQSQHHQAAKTMRQVCKQIKRNRKPDRVRRKDWKLYDLGDPERLDDLELAAGERIMPRGERERRQAVLSRALAGYGEDTGIEKKPSSAEEPSGEQGIVIEVSSGLCRVDLGDQSLICTVRGSLSSEDMGFTNVVAVGDEVKVSLDGSDRGVVEAILPRKSALARPDVYYPHLRQVIVANADQLLIVASWRDPALWLELVDRYLIAAERNNLTPIICLNKIDLAKDMPTCREALRPYLDLHYRVILSSALTGEGVDELRQALLGKTTVLAGMSGVGKSSLLMAVQPGLQLRTSVVSEYWHQGQHTTSRVSMLKLEMGGFVVDTPGIREFGLSGLRREELIRFYPEIASLQSSCRFGNCSHTGEPGCAVGAAVQQGRVSATRYHSYKKIRRSLPA